MFPVVFSPFSHIEKLESLLTFSLLALLITAASVALLSRPKQQKTSNLAAKSRLTSSAIMAGNRNTMEKRLRANSKEACNKAHQL
jgi:hypothetical protein